MAPPRRRRRGSSPHTGPSLFLLLLSQGAAAGAGFIIPPTGPATTTRLHSISPSSSSSAAAASHPVAAQAAAPPPVRTKAPQASPTTTTRRSAPLPPPPPPSLLWEPAAAPAVVEWHVVAPPAPAAPVAAPAPAEAKGGWRAAERRLRALVAAAHKDDAAVIAGCKGLLQACLADGDEAAEAAVVAWAVKDVLLPLQLRGLGGEDEALRELAFRACAATGAAEAAAALFLALPSAQRKREDLETALKACCLASSSSASCDEEGRVAALSVVRAAGGALLGARALELAVAAVDAADGRGVAAGALRLLIAEAKKALKGSAVPPAWVYARAMRATLREEAGAGAAEAVSLLYEEALSEGGDKVGDGEMALHETALAAHAAEGQWNPALAVLERLRTSRQTPSAACFNHAVHACCLAGEWERGAGLLRRMEAAGLEAAEETYLGVLQALGKAGRWEGALQLLDHVQGMQQQQQEERQSRLRVTPMMVKAAAAICVRAGKFAEARALVQQTVTASEGVSSSPELLELELWALVMAPSPLADERSSAKEAARLIEQLMAQAGDEEEKTGKPIALDAYEHACQALARSSASEHTALLRRVHAHAVAHRVIPALPSPSKGEPIDLRALRPALARVALAGVLEQLAVERERADEERQPVVLITGTGAIKTHIRRFLRSKACFDPPFNPLSMPFNHGRLLLPWNQIQRWQRAGARVCLSSSSAAAAASAMEEGESRRRGRQRLWDGIVDG